MVCTEVAYLWTRIVLKASFKLVTGLGIQDAEYVSKIRLFIGPEGQDPSNGRSLASEIYFEGITEVV
jgi:hypothetical protein